MAGCPSAVTDGRQQLEREDRQHAGHQVEDQPAKESEPQHPQQRDAAGPEPGAEAAARCRCMARQEGGLHGLAGRHVGHRQRERLALEHAFLAEAPLDRDFEYGLLAAVRELDGRFAEGEARRSLDQDIRLPEAVGRARHHAESRFFRSAGQDRALQAQRALVRIVRHLG